MTTTQHSDQLREYLWLLRRRKWEIIIVAVLVIAAAVAVTLSETKIYEGRTEVLVNATQDPNQSAGPTAPDLPTEQQVATSSAVAQIVMRSDHLGKSETALTSGLNVTPVAGTTSVLSIAYDSPSPAFAARAANAFANAYVQFRDAALSSSYTSSLATAQGQATTVRTHIARIDRHLGSSSSSAQSGVLQAQRDTLVARLGVLEQQISQLQGQAVSNGTNAAQIIQSATVPTSPIRPQKVRNAVFALVGGVLLGIVVAFLRHRLDIRLKTPREFEEELGAPVFGSVPRVSGWRHRQESLVLLTTPRSPPAEIFRTVAMALSYTAKEHGSQIVLLTSALGEEGKSTVAGNIAVAMAQAGRRVLLVSADLRRPTLHRMFGVPNVGISDVISGSKALAEVLQDPGVPDLRFIGSGLPPRDPAALIASHRMSAFVAELRAVQCDLVLMDCPPVLAVADTSILVPQSDGILYVHDATRTTRSAMEHARDQIAHSGGRIIGGVYNNFDPGTTYPGDYFTYAAYDPLPPDHDHHHDHAENGKSDAPLRPWARRSP